MKDNFRGSLFMVFAMACFALEDAFIKAAAKTMTLGEILFIFGLFGTLVFIVLTLKRGEKVFHPSALSQAILLRTLSEILGRIFFSISIVLIPLTSLSAILQATPLIVVTDHKTRLRSLSSNLFVCCARHTWLCRQRPINQSST